MQATSRHPLRTRLLMAFVLSMLAVRALIPAGFMPQAEALRQGRFVMTICLGAGGMKTVLVDADGVPVEEGASGINSSSSHGEGTRDEPSLHMEQCPFGMLAAMAVMPMALPVVVSLLRVAVDIGGHVVRQLALPPLPAQGPPLGSQAPPSILVS